MKNICKIILAFAGCVCFTIPFTGCNTYANNNNCGGIVKGYNSIGEKEKYITFPQEEHWTVIDIEVTFDKKSDIFYPYILISQSYFDYYNCTTVDELFKNKDFIDTYSTAMLLEVKNGKAIFEMNTAFKLNTSVYFYEGIKENNGSIKIEDLINYIGYFNYN